MHNKVVFRAATALNDAGLVVLRINFRGVGGSTGEHDEGRGEQDDVRAALDYLADQYPQLRLVLCGFSFGARVGLDVGIEDDRIQYLISIGTPLDKYEEDVYELAEHLSRETGLDYSKKKNRVIFLKDDRLLGLLGLKEWERKETDTK